jgi:hypothetical protein
MESESEHINNEFSAKDIVILYYKKLNIKLKLPGVQI